MPKAQTKVSVIVPVYDRATLVGRCFQSILHAGYENIEVLFVDDGSRDGSLEAVRDIAQSHPGVVRVLAHPGGRNRGVSASRNLGIAESTGQYVCFLDSDDAMLPGRFDAAIEILDRYPRIDGVYESAEIVSSDGVRAGLLVPAEEVAIGSLEGRDIDPSGSIHTGGILVRRTLFDHAGLFDVQRWVGEDIHLWLRMYSIGNLVPGMVLRPVVSYYKHSGNTKGFDTPRVELDVIASVHEWARTRPVEARKLAYLRSRYCSLFYYYLAEARRNRLGRTGELSFMWFAATRFPGIIRERRYWANIFRVFRAVAGARN